MAFAAAFVSVFCVSEIGAEGLFDGVMDRAAEGAKRKAQQRMNQRIDQTIDKAMNKTEDAVKCVATDWECLKRATDEGKKVILIDSGGVDTMKCVATDTDCLKQAKQAGKKVEIVDEEELGDTLRCASTDAACLKRAKALGKKVEITDSFEICPTTPGRMLKKAFHLHISYAQLRCKRDAPCSSCRRVFSTPYGMSAG